MLDVQHRADDRRCSRIGAAVGIIGCHRRLRSSGAARRVTRAARAAFFGNGWYYDIAITRLMGGPGRIAVDAMAWFDRTVIDGAVNGIGVVTVESSIAAAAHAERLRAPLRPRRGARRRGPPRLRRSPGWSTCDDALVAGRPRRPSAGHSDLAFPLLPAIILLPLFGALVIALIPSARPELHRMVGHPHAVGTLALTLYMLFEFQTDDPGFQFVSSTTWIAVARHQVRPRRRRDLAVPRGAHRGAVPARALRGQARPRREGYYLDHAARGRLHGRVPRPRPVPVLHHVRAHLVPLYMLIGRWGHGRRVYAATKFFIYTMFGSVLMLVSIVCLGRQRPGGRGRHGQLRPAQVVEAVGSTLDTGTLASASSASPSPSRSRRRCSRSTPGCPMPTPRRRPPARSTSPASLLKLGTYGFLRYGLFLFPQASV